MWFTFDFRRIIIFSFIILVMMFLLWISCFNSYNEKLLTGTYTSNQNAADVIIINTNHTYNHRFISLNNNVFENGGSWKFNGRQVAFNNFQFFAGSGDGIATGTWISSVEKKAGILCLIYADDSDIYYAKNNR